MDPDQELEREINAMIIQKFWKRYRCMVALRQMAPSTREPIQVYYSKIFPKQKIWTDTENLFQLLFGQRLPYFKFDLTNNPFAQNLVKDLLNKFDLPFVKIHGFFIGGYLELDNLVQQGLVPPIVSKEFLHRCLLCKHQRQDQNSDSCPNCHQKYLFFVLNKPQ